MFRTDRTIFLALCASLLLHASLLQVAAERAGYPKIYLPALRRPASSVVIALHPPAIPPPDEMGERTGTGTASSSSQGPTPLQARKADEDQPQLSRDPTGPATLGHIPTPSSVAPGEQGRGGQRGQIAVESSPEQATPTPTPAPAENPANQRPTMAVATPPRPVNPPPPPQPTPAPRESPPSEIAAKSAQQAKAILLPAETQSPPQPPATAPAVQVALAPTPAPAPQKTVPKVKAQAATGDGLAPGRAAAADPFQQSDSESDAFTTVGSAVMHDGRISVRSGRKIKTVRPHLLVPGILDTIGASDPSVQLKVNIDATGKVTFVDVVHSSGSNDIDQPCVVAMYDWWFEPSRDGKGKPIADVVLFTLSFR